MESCWPENSPPNQRQVVEELVRGQEHASELKLVLRGEGSMVTAEDLVVKILNSFTNSLSILKSVESDEMSQYPVNTNRKSEDSGESCKSSSRVKDRRGCYKRRKPLHTWIRESPHLVDDGHQWRKYGQKAILNAKYPRNYYRCTHKNDQGCQATKQVQRIGGESTIYRTTYSGRHTCKSLLNACQLFLDPPHDTTGSSVLLSFDDTNRHHHHHSSIKQENELVFSSTPSTSSIKQETKDDTLLHDLAHDNQSCSSDYLLSPGDEHHLSAFDYGADGISGVNSSSTTNSTAAAAAHQDDDISLDMDMIVTSGFDDDVLHLSYFDG